MTNELIIKTVTKVFDKFDVNCTYNITKDGSINFNGNLYIKEFNNEPVNALIRYYPEDDFIMIELGFREFSKNTKQDSNKMFEIYKLVNKLNNKSLCKAILDKDEKFSIGYYYDDVKTETKLEKAILSLLEEVVDKDNKEIFEEIFKYFN